MTLTNDAVLELLVLPDRVAIALTFMFFTIEILDRLIVKKTVSVNRTCNLVL
jgi:hypothetical protein